MRRTISLINVTAAGASTRSITRVNRFYFDAHLFGFVLNKAAELEERPAMQSHALTATNRYPIANTAKFFKGDSALSVLRSRDNAFADVVIHPSRKAAFFARKLFQAATTGLGAFGLKFLAQPPMAEADVIDGFGAVGLAIAVNGNVGDAHIDAKNSDSIIWGWLIDIADGEQVKFTVDVAEISFALLSLQQIPLPLTADKGDGLATVHCPDRYGASLQAPVEDTIIVSDAAVWFEGAFCCLVKFVGVGHFGDTTDNHLGSQAKKLTHWFVRKLVQGELPKGLGLPPLFTDPVTSGVGGFQGAQQQFGCAGCDREIEFGWSAPNRGGGIFPVECADFSPKGLWPEPRYLDAWQQRGWLKF